MDMLLRKDGILLLDLEVLITKNLVSAFAFAAKLIDDYYVYSKSYQSGKLVNYLRIRVYRNRERPT